MDKCASIFIAGKGGVAGSAIVRALRKEGYNNLLVPAHSELDFSNQADVKQYFQKKKPEYIFYTAAQMGSIIYRREHPSDILYNNLIMEMNVIHAAHEIGARKLLFMSSDFIYPDIESGVLHEDDFLSAPLPTKDMPYSLAKITGVKLCDYYRQQFGDDFFTVVPCAFFGINASFDLQRANVVGSLIKRFHDAKISDDREFVLWGTGKPRKEFLFCDDVANACVFLMKQSNNEQLINVGSGDNGITIMELAKIIQKIVGYTGDIVCDTTKPDGIMYRVMDSRKLHQLGWNPAYSLEQAIEITYEHFLTTPYANK